MAKEKISLPELIPSRFISIIYAVAIIAMGGLFCYFADQIVPFMPHRFHKALWVYLIGVGFIAGGGFIIYNKPSARTASYLLAILIFIVAVILDLRNLYNRVDDVKYIYALNLCRDLGLAATAIIIGNFQREDKNKRHRYYYKSREEKSINEPPK